MSTNNGQGNLKPATKAAIQASNARKNKQDGVYRDFNVNQQNFRSTTTTTRYDSVYRALSLERPLPTTHVNPGLQYRSVAIAPPQGANATFGGLQAPQIQQQSKMMQFEPMGKHHIQVVSATAKSTGTTTENSNTISPGPIPLLLEQNSNVTVSGDLSTLAENVTSLLKKYDVDVAFKPSKAKWKGKAYSKNKELDLRAFLYKTSSKPDMYVLEFQRRSGCAMQFSQLYKNVYQDLLKNGFVCNKQGEKKIPSAKDLDSRPVDRPFAPLPLPDDLKVDTVRDFTPLVEMAKSRYVDVQIEALTEIANQAADDSVRSDLGKSNGLMKRLVENLETKDAQVVRLCCSCLKSFTNNDATLQVLCVEVGGVHHLVRLLDRQGIDRETKRLATSALANLSAGYANVISSCGGKAVIEQLDNQEDNLIKNAFIRF